jgi:hypothetical protein
MPVLSLSVSFAYGFNFPLVSSFQRLSITSDEQRLEGAEMIVEKGNWDMTSGGRVSYVSECRFF